MSVFLFDSILFFLRIRLSSHGAPAAGLAARMRLVAQTREREGPEQEKLRRRQARLESAVVAAEALARENALGHGAAGLRQQLATQSQRREEAELAASESFVREDELTQRRG